MVKWVSNVWCRWSRVWSRRHPDCRVWTRVDVRKKPLERSNLRRGVLPRWCPWRHFQDCNLLLVRRNWWWKWRWEWDDVWTDIFRQGRGRERRREWQENKSSEGAVGALWRSVFGDIHFIVHCVVLAVLFAGASGRGRAQRVGEGTWRWEHSVVTRLGFGGGRAYVMYRAQSMVNTLKAIFFIFLANCLLSLRPKCILRQCVQLKRLCGST